MQLDPREEERLTDYLSRRIIDRASGRLDAECIRNYPHDVYFIGNLRPRDEDQNDNSGPAYLRELISKLSPFAFGCEFALRPAQASVRVIFDTTWACYYRIFPTLAQQRVHQLGASTSARLFEQGAAAAVDTQQNSGSVEVAEAATADADKSTEDDAGNVQDSGDDNGSPTDRAGGRASSRGPRDSLFIRFRKIDCRAQGEIVLSQNAGNWTVSPIDLQQAIDRELARARGVAMADPERVKTQRLPDDQIRVPDTALQSEADFNAFRSSLQTEVPVEWSLLVDTAVSSDPRSAASDVVVRTHFLNTSPSTKPAPNIEPFLFDANTKYSVQGGDVQPFELDLVPQGFRYDRNLWGRGLNCAIEAIGGAQTTFVTTHAPVYRQARYTTSSQPPARFDELAQDPIPPLERILQAMQQYEAEWDREAEALTARSGSDEERATASAEFALDRAKFQEEIANFRQGLELLRRDQDLRLAFALLNETFRRAGESSDPAKRKESWRLFQLVFIVAQIPGMAALSPAHQQYLDERRKVDIIYFPTGGGKTEAYLGVIALHCFFDRLRGKTAGVTAWTRFPLRLLTLQQTQRVADIIGIAELVRLEQSDARLRGPNVDGFAVGYFVGATGSPNELSAPSQNSNSPDPAWSQASDPQARQAWKRITRCPFCRTATVSVGFDSAKVRVLHKCGNASCRFPNGEIPVFIVDNEIYRYLPSVIVGTLDKLAGLGNQRKFSLILGQVDGVCVDHGYYKRKCCQRECREPRQLRPSAVAGLSGPTLFVQDELHLLKEGLGTFDGHYETYLQRLQMVFGQRTPAKIIASSATIEAFQRQVVHLYGRDAQDARLFPGPGPTLGGSFYATTLDYPQRFFVGVIPHNKTIFNTILELVEQCHREIQVLERTQGSVNPFGGTVTPGTDDWFALLDSYRTTLTYFLAGRELNSILTDLVGDTNPNLTRDGFSPVSPLELTGSTSTDEVSQILEHLEKPSPRGEPANTVLATSMISHGVDIDRLNMMIFYGMPRQNAEYIQASSRVGRSHVGLIFMCLHPARERDQSHYTYFSKFHEYLGQLVEPVAINRWSRFSANRTIPGLFMATLLQVLANANSTNDANQYYMLDFVKKQITSGDIRKEDFIPLLLASYLVEAPSNVGEVAFRDEIELRVPQVLDQIIGAASGLTFVSDALYPSPMRSLRDVDESIDIEFDSAGTQWADS